MSAGAFTRTKYETDLVIGALTSVICAIRVQPETITCSVNSVGNDPPSGDINLPITAVVSRGRRAKGIIPRTVTLEAGATGQPAGYKAGGLTTIPCLTDAFFQECAAATDETTVSYLGSTTWKVSYVSDERAR